MEHRHVGCGETARRSAQKETVAAANPASMPGAPTCAGRRRSSTTAANCDWPQGAQLPWSDLLDMLRPEGATRTMSREGPEQDRAADSVAACCSNLYGGEVPPTGTWSRSPEGGSTMRHCAAGRGRRTTGRHRPRHGGVVRRDPVGHAEEAGPGGQRCRACRRATDAARSTRLLPCAGVVSMPSPATSSCRAAAKFLRRRPRRWSRRNPRLFDRNPAGSPGSFLSAGEPFPAEPRARLADVAIEHGELLPAVAHRFLDLAAASLGVLDPVGLRLVHPAPAHPGSRGLRSRSDLDAHQPPHPRGADPR